MRRLYVILACSGMLLVLIGLLTNTSTTNGWIIFFGWSILERLER